MAFDQLGACIGGLIFIDPVVKFGDFVLVVSGIGVDRPYEILCPEQVGIDIELNTPVHHRADIVPLVAVSV